MNKKRLRLQKVRRRLHFKDGTYMDVEDADLAREYANDPSWDRTENMDDPGSDTDDYAEDE